MSAQGYRINETTFFKIAFGLSVCLLIIIAIVSFKQLRDVNQAQRTIIKSRDRQIELQKLSSAIKDAERMQRGFLITKKQEYFSGYTKSRKVIDHSLLCLKKLSNRRSLKPQQILSLETLVKKRLDAMDETLQIYNNTQTSATELKDYIDAGSAKMQLVDSSIDKIIQEESRALRQYEAFHKAKNRALPYMTGFLVVFTLLVFIVSFYKINKDSGRLRDMNDDLILVNKSFQYAEEISQMGHWKRSLADMVISPSDNMYRLFGHEPGAFEYNEKSILAFVHPDDRETLQQALDLIKAGKIPPEMNYRIIRPDGQVRYFRSVSKLIAINDEKLVLGATRDITPEVEINLSLKEKNNELQAAVEELASFNHIASHDLQEPLRKIQMFISRIAVEEADALSGSGKEYFERVSASALRMEQLIDDLLLYSETNKSEQVFEQTDLNLIMNEVQIELAAEIDEKQAIVQHGHLPVMEAVPFQMRQLFINLVGNALKYSKPDVAPHITISCEMVKGKDISDKLSAVRDYYKFTVSDNGIGFYQEFADKIFVLFQRLHKKEQYSGTGIGLAICRKIAENHRGMITAESTPNNGARFFIYLPK